MGMFDEVYCEADLPPDHPGSGREFQTKSLFNCLDRFTITKGGRLLLHATGHQPTGEAGDIDTEFHGDIRLVGRSDDHRVEYVARFTHGTLEWIRPLTELPEIHRALLMG